MRCQQGYKFDSELSILIDISTIQLGESHDKAYHISSQILHGSKSSKATTFHVTSGLLLAACQTGIVRVKQRPERERRRIHADKGE